MDRAVRGAGPERLPRAVPSTASLALQRAILTQHGIQPSVSRTCCYHDNAHMESFFHTLKTEWIRSWTFATFAELVLT